jgi:uncharacterized RDD family membrane protein YckC
MQNIFSHLGSRSNRLLAYIVDILPITIIVTIIFYFFFGFDEILSAHLNGNSSIEIRKEFLQQRNIIRDISFLVWIIYSTIMDCSPKQGSYGKQLFDIKIVDDAGMRLTIQKSIVRNFAKIISSLILFVGFLWIFFDKNKQGWHDKIAKCYIVDNKFINEYEV